MLIEVRDSGKIIICLSPGLVLEGKDIERFFEKFDESEFKDWGEDGDEDDYESGEDYPVCITSADVEQDPVVFCRGPAYKLLDDRRRCRGVKRITIKGVLFMGVPALVRWCKYFGWSLTFTVDGEPLINYGNNT